MKLYSSEVLSLLSHNTIQCYTFHQRHIRCSSIIHLNDHIMMAILDMQIEQRYIANRRELTEISEQKKTVATEYLILFIRKDFLKSSIKTSKHPSSNHALLI